MKWIADHAVMIAFVRAMIVTIGCYVAIFHPEYDGIAWSVVIICLITIPVLDYIKRAEVERKKATK